MERPRIRLSASAGVPKRMVMTLTARRLLYGPVTPGRPPNWLKSEGLAPVGRRRSKRED